MIDPKALTLGDVGKWVKYVPACISQPTETGRIKSWSDTFVFVVFHCDSRWGDFSEFCPQATDPMRLVAVTDPRLAGELLKGA